VTGLIAVVALRGLPLGLNIVAAAIVGMMTGLLIAPRSVAATPLHADTADST